MIIKNCMFQDKICSPNCQGWDYEHNDCRLLGMLWKITEALNYKKDEFMELRDID